MGTRSLVLPTRIERIVIDPKEHFKGVEEFGKTIPVRVSEESRIIRFGYFLNTPCFRIRILCAHSTKIHSLRLI